MKFLLLITTTFVILSLTFSGCVTTGSQNPPEAAKLVEFMVPEIGTEVEWNVVKYGEESIQSGLFSKKEIDGKLSYFWQNPTDETTSVYDLETMNWLGRWSHSDKKWVERAKPNNGHNQYPLWAGKSYTANFNYSKKNGWSGYVNTWVKVEGWETITIPAGTFEALKVVQKNKNYSYTVWYAPELRINVKYKINNKTGERSGELVKIAKP